MSDVLLQLEQFHFLRPLWLLIFPVGLLMAWLIQRRAQHSDWKHFVEPELLEALLTRPKSSSRVTPAAVSQVLLCVWVLALSGPSWQRLPSPLIEDDAPLVVGLYLGESMLKDDLKPSRLDHAKKKIDQLLQLRAGAATALLVYGGSAHTVLPLTEDAEVLRLYLQSLSPSVIPLAGNRPDKLLAVAQQVLLGRGGAVVLVGDDLREFSPMERHWNPVEDEVSVSFLSLQNALAAERRQLSSDLNSVGIDTVFATLDDSDLATLVASMQRRWRNQLQQRDDVEWIDAGYTLVWPLLLLTALFFRRGMVLRWS